MPVKSSFLSQHRCARDCTPTSVCLDVICSECCCPPPFSPPPPAPRGPAAGLQIGCKGAVSGSDKRGLAEIRRCHFRCRPLLSLCAVPCNPRQGGRIEVRNFPCLFRNRCLPVHLAYLLVPCASPVPKGCSLRLWGFGYGTAIFCNFSQLGLTLPDRNLPPPPCPRPLLGAPQPQSFP